jgi:CRISPR-associated protein Csm2
MWIKTGADPAMVKYAEKVGKDMALGKLTNSKIRSVYGEIKRIQMGEFEKEKSSFYLLKPKVAYALGRDEQNKGLQLFKKVFDDASQYVTDNASYKNFCNLLEAILAYHKANGGKD